MSISDYVSDTGDTFVEAMKSKEFMVLGAPSSVAMYFRPDVDTDSFNFLLHLVEYMLYYADISLHFWYNQNRLPLIGNTQLENRIHSDGLRKGTIMSKKIRRPLILKGVKTWVSADTEQEYAEKIIQLFQEGPAISSTMMHDFERYAWDWYNIFSKPNVSYVTALTYRRQLQFHILPLYKGKAIEEITTADVQSFFNRMGNDVTVATKNKARSVLNMIFNQAVDDGLIAKNPLDSRNLRIKGKSSAVTMPYSIENMQYLISHIDSLSNDRDRAYIALAALHPLRPEEVLGLQWQDIDLKNHTIHIRRAVTHPSRNLGMVGEPKTEASKRTISLVPQIEKYLSVGLPYYYVLGGERPLSYTQIRRMCVRIQKEINFPEPIQPRRFRTTVLTDIYDVTKDIKSAQAAAGHTTAAMTLKYYVKGRETSQDTASPIAKAYGIDV